MADMIIETEEKVVETNETKGLTTGEKVGVASTLVLAGYGLYTLGKKGVKIVKAKISEKKIKKVLANGTEVVEEAAEKPVKKPSKKKAPAAVEAAEE